MPTSSTTGAGHSKNVFSTPAGFSSERKKKYFDKCTFLHSKLLSLSFPKGNTQLHALTERLKVTQPETDKLGLH